MTTPPVKRGLHWHLRRFGCSPDGRQMLAFGVRLGYWPCLHAPFAQVAFLFWRAEVWYGEPTKTNV